MTKSKTFPASEPTTTATNSPWTADENAVIARAAFELYDLKTANGGKFPGSQTAYKAGIEREVSAIAGRVFKSAGRSIDPKFQNASAILQALGHPIIPGFRPSFDNTQKDRRAASLESDPMLWKLLELEVNRRNRAARIG